MAVTTVACCVRKYNQILISVEVNTDKMTDMFAAGAGGAHAWEIPISTFNIYLRVGLT